jgi:histone H3/H4
MAMGDGGMTASSGAKAAVAAVSRALHRQADRLSEEASLLASRGGGRGTVSRVDVLLIIARCFRAMAASLSAAIGSESDRLEGRD